MPGFMLSLSLSLGLRMDNETIRVAVGLRLYAAHTLASIVVQQLTVLDSIVSAAVSVLVVTIVMLL